MSQRMPTVFDRPLSELAAEFNYTSPLHYIEIPTPLHRQFIELYERSRDLQKKLGLVIKDGEHVLAMEEGKARGFSLPSADFMQKEIEELDRTLKSFSPYRSMKARQGYTSLHPSQVEGFFKVFALSHSLVHDVFGMFRETDYLKYQRHLRDNLGIKYAGPTSLQEIVSVYSTLARTNRMQNAYLQELSAARGLS